MANGWEIAFWILLILFIFENLLIGYIFSVGITIIEKETECQVNVCSGYDSFYYDYIEDMCYCFEDEEIVFEKYLGG